MRRSASAEAREWRPHGAVSSCLQWVVTFQVSRSRSCPAGRQRLVLVELSVRCGAADMPARGPLCLFRRTCWAHRFLDADCGGARTTPTRATPVIPEALRNNGASVRDRRCSTSGLRSAAGRRGHVTVCCEPWPWLPALATAQSRAHVCPRQGGAFKVRPTRRLTTFARIGGAPTFNDAGRPAATPTEVSRGALVTAAELVRCVPER